MFNKKINLLVQMDLGNPRPPNLPSAPPNSSNEVYWKKVGLLMIF